MTGQPMMQNRGMRILAIALTLALCMTQSCFPFVAFASEPAQESTAQESQDVVAGDEAADAEAIDSSQLASDTDDENKVSDEISEDETAREGRTSDASAESISADEQVAPAAIEAADIKTFAPIVEDKNATAAQLVVVVEFADSPVDSNAYDGAYFKNNYGIRTHWDYFIREINGSDANGGDGYVSKTYRNYFYTVSNGTYNVASYFPQTYTDGTHLRIRMDDLTAAEYANNPDNYDPALIKKIIDELNSKCPDIDYSIFDRLSCVDGKPVFRSDGYIDNLLIVPETYVTSHASKTANPHELVLGSGDKARNIFRYTVAYGGMNNGTSRFDASIAAHETLHTFDFPDLYRQSALNDSGNPVREWDVMASGGYWSWPLAFTRECLGWTSIDEVNLSNLEKSYQLFSPDTANASNGAKRQALVIKPSISDSEYFVVEYRRLNPNRITDFDGRIGGSGLIVYRVNRALENEGNFQGRDYVYVFRPGETSLTASAGDIARAPICAGSFVTQNDKTFNSSIGSTDPSAKITDGAICYSSGLNSGLVIKAVAQEDDNITFTIEYDQGDASETWKPVMSANGVTPEAFGNLQSPMTSTASDGTNLYMTAEDASFGGKCTIYKYDKSDWSQLGNPLNDMRYVKLAWLNGELYAMGASSSDMTSINMTSAKLKKYVAGAWRDVASVSGAGISDESNIAVVNGQLYMLVKSSSESKVYKLSNNSLTQVGNALPIEQAAHPTLVDIAGRACVVSGDTPLSSSWNTSLYTFNGTAWSKTRTLAKDKAAFSVSSVVFGGKTYVAVFAASGSFAKLYSFSETGSYESESDIAQGRDSSLGGTLCAGANNLYLCVASNSSGAVVYTLKDGKTENSTQLGNIAYSSCAGLAASAIGNDMYLAVLDSAANSVAVRTHTLAASDSTDTPPSSSRKIEDATITNIQNKVYSGYAQTQNPIVTLGGVTLKENVDYQLSYSNNTNAGVGATVTVKGIGLYTGTQSKTFAIIQAPLNVSATYVSPVTIQKWTGSEVKPDVTVKWNGRTLTRDIDYYVVYENNVNPGTAKMTIKGTGNFNGFKSTSFPIIKDNSSSGGSSSGGDSSGSSPEPAPAPSGSPMYRLYNPHSGEHLFTTDSNEYAVLPSHGWVQEGLAWTSPSSGEPVYRLYNPYSGDHHYTKDANEYASLPALGWRQEGLVFYSDVTRGVTVYRLFNPNVAIGTHHYTLDANEYAVLPAYGWVQEGVAWYGMG